MTRKEMIEYCVDDQIRRGIVEPSMRAVQIHYRLVGIGYAKPMSKAECERWYAEVREREQA